MTADPNLAQARAFLQRLDAEAARFCFQTFDDSTAKRAALVRLGHGDPANGALDRLAALNAKGAGIFVAINRTDGRGRQTHNITAVRAVFVDLDGAPLEPVLSAGLEPHIVAETSPGKYHVYWLCDDCPLDQFERVQRALARRFSGDPSVHDLPRVMRIPGFAHRKGEPYLSRLLDGVGAPERPPCSLAEIVGTLRLDLDPKRQQRANTGSGTDKITQGDRNAHLFSRGRSMARKGLSREAVAAALGAENTARCDPPLDDERIRYVVERVFSAKDSPEFEAQQQARASADTARKTEQAVSADSPVPPRYSENRIARDFVSRHESALRFVPEWGRWIVWTGSHWRRDDGGEAAAMISTELARVSADMLVDPTIADSERARDRATRSVNTDKVRRGVEAFARIDQRIVVRSSDLDTHDHLLNTPVGTVDLRTGKNRAHRREDLITRCTTATPAAGGALFRRVLGEITCGDDGLAAYLQRALGACLFGSSYSSDHWLMFWHGTGRNGKNTLGDVVAWVLGSYAKTVPSATLIADEHGQAHPTVIANLCGLRLAVSSEIEEGARWSESRIKSLTGDETIAARFMRQDFFEFRRTHRHLIYGNHRPILANPDPALAARLHLVPFNADFSGDRGDPTIPARLRAEAGAILQWLIDGATTYHEDGGTLRKCKAVEDATRAYFDMQSTFDHWLAECTRPDEAARIKAGDLYRSYSRWKEERGERPLSQTRWGEEMGRRFRPYRTTVERGYAGVALRDPYCP